MPLFFAGALPLRYRMLDGLPCEQFFKDIKTLGVKFNAAAA